MTVEVKTIRSDIPGHQPHFGSYPGQEESRKLFVGRDISLSGEITACDHLIIEGNVSAELRGSRRMDILEGGQFSGCVEVQEAMIAGRFEGDLVVHGKLSVRSTGQIMGRICYGALEVSAGAAIEGTVEVIQVQQGYGSSDAAAEAAGREAKIPETRRERLEKLKNPPEIQVEIRGPKKAAA